MKTLVRIESQYFENYGSAEAPHWKPKGGQEFTIRIDSDILFYNKEGMESVIANMLDNNSTEYARYELISTEPVFCEPIELDSDIFNVLYDAQCDMTEAEAYQYRLQEAIDEHGAGAYE